MVYNIPQEIREQKERRNIYRQEMQTKKKKKNSVMKTYNEFVILQGRGSINPSYIWIYLV